jgi:gliding motility-associated-like protein
MKKTILSFTIIFCLSSLFSIVYSQNITISRQVIGNAGGSHTTNNLQIMDNVGEVMVSTESNSELIITQGFEQPHYSFKVENEFVCDNENIVNAFIPNSTDPLSNKWIIEFLYFNENSENTVTIYNRWGDILETISNYDNVNNYWDGTNKNNQYLPSGTYFFTIEVPQNNIRCSNWVQIVKEN